MGNYPTFGAQSGFVRSSVSKSADQAELQSGLQTFVFVRSTTTECSATTSDCAWGIVPPSTDVIYDSVKITIEDEQDINYTAAQAVGSPDPTKDLLKAKCCVIKRAKVTVSIEGKGTAPYNVGDTIAETFKPAIGTGDLVVPPTGGQPCSDVRCTRSAQNSTDQDWEKFTIEGTGYIEQAAGATGTLAEAFYSGTAPTGCGTACVTVRFEHTLSGTGYAETTITKTSHPQ